MNLIPLTKGLFSLVDDQDFNRLNQYAWSLSSTGYAWRAVGGRKNNHNIFMHREITNAPDNLVVDHINRNKLDNRRENLRVCESKENSWNRVGWGENSTSQYKGVHWSENSWKATISPAKICIVLGKFDNEEDAARAYDIAAVEYFGEFARLNFPVAPEEIDNLSLTNPSAVAIRCCEGLSYVGEPCKLKGRYFINDKWWCPYHRPDHPKPRFIPERGDKLITYNGKSMTQSDWAREINIPPAILSWRLRHNWGIEKALTTPIDPLRSERLKEHHAKTSTK